MKRKKTNTGTELLIISNGIKNLDSELYKYFKTQQFYMTDKEINAAMLLKSGYLSSEIMLFMDISANELEALGLSILQKLGIKDLNKLKTIKIYKEKKQGEIK